jgi:hypothetical protein
VHFLRRLLLESRIVSRNFCDVTGEGMFPLSGTGFPKSSDALAVALRNSLAELFSFPDLSAVVKIEGAKWPALDRVAVNLSGGTVRIAEPPPKPEPVGPREPGITVGQLAVLGHPMRYQQSVCDLDVTARNVSFDFGRDAAGKPMLVLTDATDGHVEFKVAKKDLQSAILAAATTAAKPHGIVIQELEINLASDGPRSLALDVRVKAKKMILSGVVVLRGKVDVDDNLVATLSNLACTGGGAIGSMAAAVINTKLKSVDGKRIPLTSLSLGDVSLHDVKISIASDIAVSADFGRKP